MLDNEIIKLVCELSRECGYNKGRLEGLVILVNGFIEDLERSDLINKSPIKNYEKNNLEKDLDHLKKVLDEISKKGYNLPVS